MEAEQVICVEGNNTFLRDLNRDSETYFIGALSYYIEEAQKTGKKTISIKNIESCVRTAIECSKQHVSR